MSSEQEIREILLNLKPRLSSQYGVRELGLFGSFVRGDADEKSDVDILVDYEHPPTLFEFVRLQDELTQHLGIPVDLVMKSALKPHIGQRILAQVVFV